MKYDKLGRELPTQAPKRVRTGLGAPLTIAQQVQRLVRNELSRAAQKDGRETFQEANDFDVDDDDLPETSYEVMAREIPRSDYESVVNTRGGTTPAGTPGDGESPGQLASGADADDSDDAEGHDVRDVGERRPAGSGPVRPGRSSAAADSPDRKDRRAGIGVQGKAVVKKPLPR